MKVIRIFTDVKYWHMCTINISHNIKSSSDNFTNIWRWHSHVIQIYNYYIQPWWWWWCKGYISRFVKDFWIMYNYPLVHLNYWMSHEESLYHYCTSVMTPCNCQVDRYFYMSRYMKDFWMCIMDGLAFSVNLFGIIHV